MEKLNLNVNKMLKDLTDSAREFASFGLTAGSKALDYTATQLKALEVELKKNAEKLAPEKDAKADAEPAQK